MQIDSNRIRTERIRRAWSQEHLAEVAGLSLRTVQRVETAGSASYETARALAAVLEFDIPAIQVRNAPPSMVGTRLRYAGLAAALVLTFGIFFTRDARAGEVMLDVGVTLNQEKLGQHQLVAQEGKSAEIKLEGKLRLFVNPIVTKDGRILLSMRVEEPAGGGWREVEEPRILVFNGDQGTVKVTSPKGNVIEIAIRPRRM